ncbi:MAG: D-aminoacyl-tRNA deacylase [Elusimicrobia bacterium]|nr:D-aminoacyl-tRNA deacylase [Elusimicrobiota bacterium]
MRVLIQRVRKASVSVDNDLKAAIGGGYVIFLGVGEGDTEKDADYLADKTANLRIFSNDEGKFDYSLLDIKGEVLVISQFTLYGNTQKGRRPDFAKAAKPNIANKLYQYFNESLRKKGARVKTGIFAAEMLVEIINDGPVTIMIDSIISATDYSAAGRQNIK